MPVFHAPRRRSFAVRVQLANAGSSCANLLSGCVLIAISTKTFIPSPKARFHNPAIKKNTPVGVMIEIKNGLKPEDIPPEIREVKVLPANPKATNKQHAPMPTAIQPTTLSKNEISRSTG
jgi:hypothetical protein